jgi:hypothetical protein
MVLVSALDDSTTEVSIKTPPKGKGRKLQTELNDTEGWRNTKQRRRHSYPTTNPVHVLDSDGKLAENLTFQCMRVLM